MAKAAALVQVASDLLEVLRLADREGCDQLIRKRLGRLMKIAIPLKRANAAQGLERLTRQPQWQVYEQADRHHQKTDFAQDRRRPGSIDTTGRTRVKIEANGISPQQACLVGVCFLGDATNFDTQIAQADVCLTTLQERPARRSCRPVPDHSLYPDAG